MINILFSGVAVALLLAAGYWVRGRGGHRPTGTRAMAVFLTSFALAFASYVPIVERAVESVIPHVARLLSNSATLCAATAVLAFLFQLNLEPEQARRMIRLRVILLAAAITGMTTLFTIEGLTDRSPTLYAFYVLIYITYLGFTARDFLVQTWRQSKRSRRPSQRIGLRITAAGCVFALMYTAYKVFVIISVGLGLELIPDGTKCTSPVTPVQCTFSVTSPALAVLLIAIGLTLPAAVWPISQFLRRRWETRSYEKLGPLWADVTKAAPEVVLDPSGSGSDENADDSDYLLHRRVIEINDGVLALRLHRSPLIQAGARALAEAKGIKDTPQGEALVEAAVISAAVHAQRNGNDFVKRQAPPAAGGPSREGNLRAETEWLLLVAAAYADSSARVVPAAPPAVDAPSDA
ncbi:MAB_1171c family putative transporter [Streptomyces jumonjinensis]|uniref:MAB_1171c family putative transporter n=1 Tax=Streptomyces jumonjinensis TaxID=1945 RepID=UPI00378AE755